MENDIHVFVLLFTGKEKRDGKQAETENINGTSHKSMVTNGRIKAGKKRARLKAGKYGKRAVKAGKYGKKLPVPVSKPTKFLETPKVRTNSAPFWSLQKLIYNTTQDKISQGKGNHMPILIPFHNHKAYRRREQYDNDSLALKIRRLQTPCLPCRRFARYLSNVNLWR